MDKQRYSLFPELSRNLFTTGLGAQTIHLRTGLEITSFHYPQHVFIHARTISLQNKIFSQLFVDSAHNQCERITQSQGQQFFKRHQTQ